MTSFAYRMDRAPGQRRLAESGRERIDELIERFTDAVAARSKALDAQDAPKARRYLAIANSMYGALKVRGDGALAKLFALSAHGDPDIRLAVALRALEYAPDAAQAVLHDLAEAHVGRASVTAGYVLEAWRNGKRPWDSLGD